MVTQRPQVGTMNTLEAMMVSINRFKSCELGMYEGGDPYGDEVEGGEEDKNDGLNALVRINRCLKYVGFLL